jgi:hypothetical protein
MMDATEQARLRAVFKRRRAARKVICFGALALMVGVTLLAFPSWELFGLPKLVWAPFFYLVMFGLIIAIAVMWRCPSCNALLGDVFSTRFCSKCGMCLDDGETASDPKSNLMHNGSSSGRGDKGNRAH